MALEFAGETVGSGSITSGMIVRRSVGWPDMASGAIRSGHLNTTGAPTGSKYLRDDFAWTSLSPASGSIGSGTVQSGAVQGFFGPTRNIASGTLGVFDLGSGAVVAGAVGSGGVVSGNVASGQISSHLADGAAGSGAIASGSVGRFHVSSGAVGSGALDGGSVMGALGGGPRNIASGTVGPNDIGSGGVLSGNVASGQVSRFKLASGAIDNAAIGSGVVSRFHLGSGAVNSGHVGNGAILGSILGGSIGIVSGSLGPNDLGSGAITSGDIGSGQVGNTHVASGAITSGRLGVTGTPDGTRFLQQDFTWASVNAIAGSQGSGVVRSGNIASGQVGTFHFASGDIITYSRNLIFDQYRTEEIVSGVRCVQISLSGTLRLAMAAVSGRMPATGIVFANAASGTVATMVRFGLVLGPSSEIGSGLCISGRQGRSLWVGASGQVVTLSGGGPTIGVGATNSGAYGQRIGTSAASGAILVDVVPSTLFSGAANITTNIVQWPI